MASPTIDVWDVSDWEVVSDETAGNDEKRWLIELGTDVRWLFKPPTDKNGFRQGEDWSERVSSDLARLIAVPCADVQLAHRHGQPGSISKNLRPDGWEMQSGALLLADAVAAYQPGSAKVRGRPGHSLARIRDVLRGAGAPPASRLPEHFGAFDVFAGFMVLDAWIANRDRHDENWSILIPPSADSAPRRLCGSYDQAGGLGFNVSAMDCTNRLARRDGVSSWAYKGTAHRFEHDPDVGPPTLVDHAVDALMSTSAEVQDFWMTQLAEVAQDTVVELFSKVPNLSEPCRNFAVEVLRINQRRLCDAVQQRGS